MNVQVSFTLPNFNFSQMRLWNGHASFQGFLTVCMAVLFIFYNAQYVVSIKWHLSAIFKDITKLTSV